MGVTGVSGVDHSDLTVLIVLIPFWLISFWFPVHGHIAFPLAVFYLEWRLETWKE